MTMSRPIIPFILFGLASSIACHDGGKDGGSGGSPSPGASSGPAASPSGASAALPAGTADAVGAPDPARAQLLLSVPFRQLPSGHEVADAVEGSGATLDAGMTAVFTSAIYAEDGAVVERTDPQIGPTRVRHVGSEKIEPHVNAVLLGMKVGGMRRLRIAATALLGAGTPPFVKPGANVILEIELQDAQPAPEILPFPDLSKIALTRNTSGLQWADLIVGDGAEIVEGGAALLDYTGWLENGTIFESSLQDMLPLSVENIGIAPIIEGWNEGLRGIRQGGRRLLVVPPGLAYGSEGSPPNIPPKATLVFVIDVVLVRQW